MHLSSEEPSHTVANHSSHQLSADVVESQATKNIRPSGIESLLSVAIRICKPNDVGKVEYERKANNRKVPGISLKSLQSYVTLNLRMETISKAIQPSGKVYSATQNIFASMGFAGCDAWSQPATRMITHIPRLEHP